MSVVMYGPKGTKLVDPYEVHAALKEGWSLSRDTIPSATPIEQVKIEVEEDNKLLKRINLDELSDDEIRVAAKDLKIQNWYNKRIDKLKGEISAS